MSPFPIGTLWRGAYVEMEGSVSGVVAAEIRLACGLHRRFIGRMRGRVSFLFHRGVIVSRSSGTLTSTVSGGMSMNRCTSGLRSLMDATLYALMIA